MAKSDFAEYKTSFSEYLKRQNWTDRSIRTYLDDLNQFIRFIVNIMEISTIEKITPQTIGKYQSYLYYYRKPDEKKYSVNTQIKKLVVVRSFFDFLSQTGKVMINPAKKMVMPKEEKKLVKKPFSDTELRKLFSVIDRTTDMGFRDYVIFKLFYVTGIRVTELIKITLDDLDFENEILKVHGKGRKIRHIPLLPIAVKLLKQYISKIRPGYDMSKQKQLFLTMRGNGFSDKNEIRMILKKYLKKAGITRLVGTHHFRVTCATRMMENGASIRHIQELLGHEDIHTVERYLKADMKSIKEVHSKTHPRET